MVEYWRLQRGWSQAELVGSTRRADRQRVALARALASGPRFLLLDEPFSALDRAAHDELRRLVRGLVDELLLVTHDQADVDALADAVVTFEAGRTVG